MEKLPDRLRVMVAAEWTAGNDIVLQDGTLQYVEQVSNDAWIMRWSVTGERHKLSRYVSTFGRIDNVAMPKSDWPGVLERIVSPFQAMTPYRP